MKKIILVAFAFATIVITNASAWDNQNNYGSYGTAYQTPQTKRSYDYKTGNSYTTTYNSDGSAKMKGYNYNTGSSWSTNYKSNGDMNGYDSNNNAWKYNANTGSYYNYGTGEYRQKSRRR